MGKIKKRLPVKLLIGLIFQEEAILSKTKILLSRFFGRIDYQSPILPFTHTDYYREEFGENLKRQFLTFSRMIDAADLSGIKIITNKIEQKLSLNKNKRRINIDPGYLNAAKLVLATTKDFSHRVYLKNGIYAEVTLSFKDKMFCPHEWTYPDYKSAEYAEIFHKIRDAYLCSLPT